VFPTVYDTWSHVYQQTLVFDLEGCLEMKMEGLEQSPCGWGSHGGYCDRVTNNSYVPCSEHPIENAWDFWASEKVKRAEEIG
jgi:hypothetical protein